MERFVCVCNVGPDGCGWWDCRVVKYFASGFNDRHVIDRPASISKYILSSSWADVFGSATQKFGKRPCGQQCAGRSSFVSRVHLSTPIDCSRPALQLALWCRDDGRWRSAAKCLNDAMGQCLLSRLIDVRQVLRCHWMNSYEPAQIELCGHRLKMANQVNLIEFGAIIRFRSEALFT
jgi:hypothetical protein